MTLLCCACLSSPGRDFEPLFKLQAGFTPPIALGMLAFHDSDLVRHYETELIVYSLFGLFLWSVLAAGLWNGTVRRFAELTNRDSPPRSEAPLATSKGSKGVESGNVASPDDADRA